MNMSIPTKDLDFMTVSVVSAIYMTPTEQDARLSKLENAFLMVSRALKRRFGLVRNYDYLFGYPTEMPREERMEYAVRKCIEVDAEYVKLCGTKHPSMRSIGLRPTGRPPASKGQRKSTLLVSAALPRATYDALDAYVTAAAKFDPVVTKSRIIAFALEQFLRGCGYLEPLPPCPSPVVR